METKVPFSERVALKEGSCPNGYEFEEIVSGFRILDAKGREVRKEETSRQFVGCVDNCQLS